MRPLVLFLAMAGLAAAGLDGGTLDLPPGSWTEPITVTRRGGTLRATAPVELSGPIRLETHGPAGIEATIIAHSLRGVAQDDWRRTQPVGGRTRMPVIDRGQAFGTRSERKAWRVSGSNDDWENFSVQWDGFLAVPVAGTELATASDDGSRVWLDRNHDGSVQADEWGVNGWGEGQGVTQRTVHAGLQPGVWRIRVQYEEGGGGNACALRWRLPGKDWATVPPAAFHAAARLAIEGPITLAGPIEGDGSLRLGHGIRLAKASAATLEIAGDVVLAGDLDLAGNPPSFSGGSLALAGHRLRLGQSDGNGVIHLDGGTLELSGGTYGLAIDGPGMVQVNGEVVVGTLGPEARVGGGTLRSANRTVLRTNLTAPLSTVVALHEGGDGDRNLELLLDLPPDTPAGLGVGIWRADRQGRWFQRILPQSFGPGRHRLTVDLGADDVLLPEGHRATWSSDAAADAGRIGAFFYTTTAATTGIAIDSRLSPAAAPVQDEVALNDLVLGPPAVATGRRWSLSVRPDPFPADASDPEVFALELVVTRPDGTAIRYAGFLDEPVVAIDRGDREVFRTCGPPRFQVRFRPTLPGIHQLRLEARWAGQPMITTRLPDVVASGAPWDDIVRVDAQDPRFFSAGGSLVWPAGCSLNSTYDTRSRGALQTKLTPDRGTFTRMALLERLAAGGATACEVWLSPWNLGLEWDPAWAGYRGIGRYHAGHAWAIDRLLDRAEELGMRINLSLFNHGMARAGTGAEEDWENHPYSTTQPGGWLAGPAGLFTDDRAFAQQRRLFRYLIARYGDSPAILGWKLWAEMNLAQAPRDQVRRWHERATAAFAELDPWRHPVTTHWCGDWNSVERGIASQQGLGYITIDAYKGDNRDIASLLCQSTRDPRQPGAGLADLGKPLLVTEFGGSAGATTRTRMAAEHAVGPWAGLVAGHAGAPMLWWFEWIDQEDRFAVYGAINRFLVFEDLRDPKASCIAPAATGAADLWCRAWSRPGRVLGYLLDNQWGKGGNERAISGAVVRMPSEVAAGAMRLEWWDADRGVVVNRRSFQHPGGTLDLPAPDFRRHLAFKLFRLP